MDAGSSNAPLGGKNTTSSDPPPPPFHSSQPKIRSQPQTRTQAPRKDVGPAQDDVQSAAAAAFSFVHPTAAGGRGSTSQAKAPVPAQGNGTKKFNGPGPSHERPALHTGEDRSLHVAGAQHQTPAIRPPPPTPTAMRPPSATRHRPSSLLAGAGPSPRVVPHGLQYAGASSGHGVRAYTPPTSQSSIANDGTRPPVRAAGLGVRTVAGSTLGQDARPLAQTHPSFGGQHENVRHPQTAGSTSHLRPHPASQQSFHPIPPRASPPTVFPDLDADFLAARDLAQSVPPGGSAQSMPIGGGAAVQRMSPVQEKDESAGVDGTEVGVDGDVPMDAGVDAEEPEYGASHTQAFPRMDSPSPSSAENPQIPGRPHKVKSTSRSASGRADSGAEGADDIGERALSRGSSGGGRAATSAGKTGEGGGGKRQRSRTDPGAKEEEAGERIAALFLAGANETLALDRAYGRSREELVGLRSEVKGLRATNKEAALRAHEFEKQTETMRYEQRKTRDLLNKSQQLVLDEVSDVKGGQDDIRTRLDGLSESDGKLLGALGELFDERCDPMREAVEEMRERVRKADETIEYLKGELNGKAGDLAERIARINELEEREAEKNALIKEKETENRGLLISTTRLEDKIQTLERSEADLKQLEKLHGETAQDVVRLGRDLENAESRVAAIKADHDALQSAHEALQAAFHSDQGRNVALVNELSDAKAAVTRVTDEAALLRKARADAEAIIQVLQHDLEGRQAEAEDLRQAAERKAKQLEGLRAEKNDMEVKAAEMSSRKVNDKVAEIETLSSRIQGLESSLSSVRAELGKSHSQKASLEAQLGETVAVNQHRVDQLEGQLENLHETAKGEKQKFAETTRTLEEKARASEGLAKEIDGLRVEIKCLQEDSLKRTAEHNALQNESVAQRKELDAHHARGKTLAVRFKSGDLDPEEQALVKIITKGVEATTQKAQVDLENQLKRADKTIHTLRGEKLAMEKKLDKQLARSGSGKTRDLIDPNAMDQSSTPSSVHEKGRQSRDEPSTDSLTPIEGHAKVLVPQSRSNSGSMTEISIRPGRLTALSEEDEENEDDDEVEESLPRWEDSVPPLHAPSGRASTAGKRAAPASGEGDWSGTKRLRSSTGPDPTLPLSRPSVSAGKTYRKNAVGRRTK